QSLLNDSRVELFDIEFIVLDEHSKRDDWLPVLEAGAVLGAKYLNVCGNDPDAVRFEANLAQLVQDATQHGIIVVLEPVAYRVLDSYSDSIKLAQKYNCVVEFDGLHFVRTGAQLHDVARHVELFPIAQLC